MPAWSAQRTADDVHVIPRDDLITHHLIGGCICGPTLEPIKRDDGSMGWLYTHHSLDGREHAEH